MATENLTVTGTQPKSFEELICSPSLADGLKKHASYLSTVNFLLSLTAFLGNSLILVALHKESSLHPPSKLLYRCLATTDLLIGLATQPLYTIHWISLVREDWVLCRFAFDTAFILGYQLGIVSLLTSSSHSNARSCSTTTEGIKCTEHRTIQKGRVQCTVGTVSISYLLCPIYCSGNFNSFK